MCIPNHSRERSKRVVHSGPRRRPPMCYGCKIENEGLLETSVCLRRRMTGLVAGVCRSGLRTSDEKRGRRRVCAQGNPVVSLAPSLSGQGRKGATRASATSAENRTGSPCGCGSCAPARGRIQHRHRLEGSTRVANRSNTPGRRASGRGASDGCTRTSGTTLPGRCRRRPGYNSARAIRSVRDCMRDISRPGARR